MKLLTLLFAMVIAGGIAAPVLAQQGTQQDGTTRGRAMQCMKDAAREFEVPVSLLFGLGQAENDRFTIDCGRYRDEARLLAAALKDSNGDVRKALSRIHAGPAGPSMQKALVVIASRTRAK